ncbi:unnamed protein product [Natator depressus]
MLRGCSPEGDCPRVLTGLMGSSSRASPGHSNLQEAVAQAFQREFDNYGKQDSYFVQLAQELQQKRDWLVRSLVAVGMKPIVPEGTYFLMADVSEFTALKGWIMLGAVAAAVDQPVMGDASHTK